MYLRPAKTLTAEGCSQTGPIGNLSDHVFRSQQFWKYLRLEARLFFFQMLNILCKYQNHNGNLKKRFLVS